MTAGKIKCSTECPLGGTPRAALRDYGKGPVYPKELGPEIHCADEVQQQVQTTDPSSRQRERPTSTNSQLCQTIIKIWS
jgi:hypothetical protein